TRQEFPSMSDLNFDPFQFAGRPGYAVDAEYSRDGWTSHGVAFEDFQRMQATNSSVSRRHKRWTPAFAASPEKLRKTLLQRAWTWVHGYKPLPATADWKTINAAATKKSLEGCREHEQHVAPIRRAGGYLESQAAIAYRAWLL